MRIFKRKRVGLLIILVVVLGVLAYNVLRDNENAAPACISKGNGCPAGIDDKASHHRRD